MADKFGHIRRNRQDKVWSCGAHGTTGSAVNPDGTPGPLIFEYNFNCLLSDDPNIRKYFCERKLNVNYFKREFIVEAANLFEEIAHDSIFLLKEKKISPKDNIQNFAKRNLLDLRVANNFYTEFYETIEFRIKAAKKRLLQSADSVIEDHLYGGSLLYRELNFKLKLSWKPLLEPITQVPEQITKNINIG
jgi:hypothetical protein